MSRVIRLVHEADAGAIAAIYAPFCRDTPVSFETEAPSVEEIERRIRKTLKSYPWLVCADESAVLGYAYASQHRERAAYRWSVDVSVYTREGHRGSGIGRALYTSLLAVLRLQGFRTALAGATLPNPGSVALHEGMGFMPVGTYCNIGFKCGKWHDVKWWQLPLADGQVDPSEPLDMQQASELPEWQAALAAGTSLLV
jgi:phosphinothricin acetyltransferase